MKKIIFMTALACALGILAVEGAQAAPKGGFATKVDACPNTTAINNRLLEAMRLVQDDLRTGKITKAQAARRWALIQQALQQLMTYMQSNNMADLTTGQLSTMNGLMDSESVAP